MKIIRLSFYWLQVIEAVLVTLFLGVIPLIRGILNNSCKFYLICFALLIYAGITLLLQPSIKELREAQKR